MLHYIDIIDIMNKNISFDFNDYYQKITNKRKQEIYNYSKKNNYKKY
jgi:hypothetical protein